VTKRVRFTGLLGPPCVLTGTVAIVGPCPSTGQALGAARAVALTICGARYRKFARSCGLRGEALCHWVVYLEMSRTHMVRHGKVPVVQGISGLDSSVLNNPGQAAGADLRVAKPIHRHLPVLSTVTMVGPAFVGPTVAVVQDSTIAAAGVRRTPSGNRECASTCAVPYSKEGRSRCPSAVDAEGPTVKPHDQSTSCRVRIVSKSTAVCSTWSPRHRLCTRG
jgi:hypothetical protein